MTSAAEAIYLPMLFLTVALAGGVRVAAQIALVPPPLFALVLSLLLLGVLVRSGTLALDRLMDAARPGLANLSGLVVLLTTFFAAAQAFNLATPDYGLPRLLCNLFFLVLLLNTLAAAPDRVRVLRSLMVIFGGMFTLKFIVLAALSDPVDGAVKRALLALLQGVTLGTLTQERLHPATGYVAFFTLVTFMVGLALLPSRDVMPGGRERFDRAGRELPPRWPDALPDRDR
jgi:hypothetical protein